jgi:SAM-dependent methyltransferase
VSERIPARYRYHPADQFADAIRPRLHPGVAILDVGSGRRPAVDPAQRPAGSRYVGLDVSAAELARAPDGAYTETVVADVSTALPELAGRFDLLVSWQVLEHVASTERALANLHGYLRPGGALVAVLSGRFALYGVLNRLVPARLATWGLRTFTGRDPETVYPAHYDRCDHRGLTELLAPWRSARVQPIYQGGAYLNFAKPLRAAYLSYESWAARSGRTNLATHYLVVAER